MVLFVDDDNATQDLAREILHEQGFRVLTATGGSQALQLYREHATEIQLVVLDLLMPGMDGGETFLELKKLNPDVKAFFCTGHVSSEVMRSLLEDENLKALQKPIRNDEFVSMVREVLDAR